MQALQPGANSIDCTAGCPIATSPVFNVQNSMSSTSLNKNDYPAWSYPSGGSFSGSGQSKNPINYPANSSTAIGNTYGPNTGAKIWTDSSSGNIVFAIARNESTDGTVISDYNYYLDSTAASISQDSTGLNITISDPVVPVSFKKYLIIGGAVVGGLVIGLILLKLVMKKRKARKSSSKKK